LVRITFLLAFETRKFLKISLFYFFTRLARLGRIALVFSRKAIFVRHTILAKIAKRDSLSTLLPTPALSFGIRGCQGAGNYCCLMPYRWSLCKKICDHEKVYKNKYEHASVRVETEDLSIRTLFCLTLSCETTPLSENWVIT
jgi:hypothetical protein